MSQSGEKTEPLCVVIRLFISCEEAGLPGAVKHESTWRWFAYPLPSQARRVSYGLQRMLWVSDDRKGDRHNHHDCHHCGKYIQCIVFHPWLLHCRCGVCCGSVWGIGLTPRGEDADPRTPMGWTKPTWQIIKFIPLIIRLREYTTWLLSLYFCHIIIVACLLTGKLLPDA